MAERETKTPKTTSTGMRAYVKGDIKESIKTAGDLSKKYDRDYDKLGAKGFKEKYGVSYSKAKNMLAEGRYGDMANKYREEYGDKNDTAKMYDELAERRSKAQGKAKGGMIKKTGYAKGGMVKANCGASMKPNGKARK